MKKYESKCDAVIRDIETLFENAVGRMQTGGWLSGDYAKIKKDYLSSPEVKNFTDQMKEILKSLVTADTLLKVSDIKSNTSEISHGTSIGKGMPDSLWADVNVEYAPGRWGNPISLPLYILDQISLDKDSMEGFVKYDEKLVRPSPNPDPKEQAKMKPGNVPETHIGSKVDQTLPNSDTKNANAKDPADGRSQVEKPKEVKVKKESFMSDCEKLGQIYFEEILNRNNL